MLRPIDNYNIIDRLYINYNRSNLHHLVISKTPWTARAGAEERFAACSKANRTAMVAFVTAGTGPGRAVGRWI